jgi:hypothetical protein
MWMQILFPADSAVRFIFFNSVFVFYNMWKKYYLGDKIKKQEIGGAQYTYGVDEKCIQDLGVEIWVKRPLVWTSIDGY